MERLGYIKELEIRRDTIKKELELIEQLLSTVSVLSIVNNGLSSDVSSKLEKQDKRLTIRSNNEIPRKEDQTWRDYIISVLKQTGRSKSSRITRLILQANPEIDSTTAERAVRHHLSKLARNGEINAEGNKNIKSVGFYYSIKEE
jgi:hypothetical protein